MTRNNLSTALTPPNLSDRERLQLLAENISSGIFETDTRGHILSMNQTGCTLFGTTPEDILQQHWHSLFPKTEQERVARFFTRALEGDTLRFEGTRQSPTGTATLFYRLVPLKIKNGTVSGLIGIVQDITDLKKTEAMLFSAQKKYRSVIDNIPDMLAEISPEGTFLFVNRVTPGRSLDKIIGSSWANHLPKDQQPIFLDALEKTKTTGHPHEFEVSSVLSNGQTAWWGCKLTPQIENGILKNFLLLARDITEKKKAEKEKQQILEQLFQAQKLESLGKLAGGVAHEFNNLLAIIQLHTAMLHDRFSGDNESAHELGVIAKSAERAEELTRQLLGFARKGKYGAKPIDVEPIVKEAIGLLKTSLPGKGKINIKLHTSPHLPQIQASDSQVLQCLMNLGLNAIDAMPNGGQIDFSLTTIEAKDAKTNAPRSYVAIRVQDTGEGISPENLEKIFDPFFTTKDIGKGTGLGLSMIYGIMDNHDGQVKVASAPGEGATFTLLFPALLGENTHEKTKNPHRRR